MSDTPLFQNTDDQEHVYAPEQLPDGQRARVVADERSDANKSYLDNEAPAAAPVGNLGNAPSAQAAPPNIGHVEHGGASGDPNTQARDPFDPEATADRH